MEQPDPFVAAPRLFGRCTHAVGRGTIEQIRGVFAPNASLRVEPRDPIEGASAIVNIDADRFVRLDVLSQWVNLTSVRGRHSDRP